MCVCVCVCGREREGEGEDVPVRMYLCEVRNELPYCVVAVMP